MNQRGFLARIGSGQRNIDTLESIVEHLQVMLNTCMGESVSAPDFGILDLTDTLHSLPKSIHTIQQAVRSTILKYEPRLKNVSVRTLPVDDESILRFEIVARLNDESRSVVRLQTEMEPGGKFKVS